MDWLNADELGEELKKKYKNVSVGNDGDFVRVEEPDLKLVFMIWPFEYLIMETIRQHDADIAYDGSAKDCINKIEEIKNKYK